MPRSTSKPTRSRSDGKRLNKSAWIRVQPRDISAKDLVAKAKVEGVTLSIEQVYNASSCGKAVATGSRRVVDCRSACDSASEDLHALSRQVLKLGFAQVDRVVADLVQRLEF